MSRINSYGNLSQLNEGAERRGTLRSKSRMNIPISSDRTEFLKKLPLKSTSFQTSFRRTSDEILPQYNAGEQFLSKTQHSNFPISYKASQKGRNDILPTISASTAEGYSSDQQVRSNSFKASEKGKGDILPTAMKIDGYTSDHSWSNTNPLTNVKTISQKLLRRRTSSDVLVLDHSPKRPTRKSHFDYHESKNHHNPFAVCGLKLWMIFKNSDWIQILTCCCVFYIVYDSYLKVVQTSGQLQKLRDEEGMMMMHLHRIEQQSIQLHETVAKLSDMTSNLGHGNQDHDAWSPKENLIHAQTQQLYEMEQELDHELHSLQANLQQAARASIIRQYGDGPIKVVLEMDIPDSTDDNAVSILLWYDTPHAAWTWLKQIQIGEWNGSELNVDDLSFINSQPVILNAGTLDFLEKSQKNHEPWTVGLTNHMGNLNMFINLKDNSSNRKRAVCVGKIIDGFDVIKKILGASQAEDSRPIRIRQASAGLFVREAKLK